MVGNVLRDLGSHELEVCDHRTQRSFEPFPMSGDSHTQQGLRKWRPRMPRTSWRRRCCAGATVDGGIVAIAGVHGVVPGVARQVVVVSTTKPGPSLSSSVGESMSWTSSLRGPM